MMKKSWIVTALVCACLCSHVVAQQQKKRHVLVISLDGMGADYVVHADRYGLKIPTLRRFMKEGVYAEGVTGVNPVALAP
ncbi:hypothetical protein FTW19_05055 [Terriglobus albidus]|uniref:Alkaline phosphatase family protein n=1 Tax=Terriglobus albidus TaxID=1592106 RepID=A0A5B9E7A6_9BACT|nr:alkaline phosphatase family protein [Terriglobus albidus]QEE27434.1 hypothetical protein FTW19_05055 [Terriglobus albidus]